MDAFTEVRLRRLVYDADRAEHWRRCLAPDEQARLDGFAHPRRRDEFVLGRAAARTLLAEVLEAAPPDVPLVVAPGGGVDVAAPPWHVSITHKHRRAVAAVAPAAVGVDLEARRAPSEGLWARILRPDERQAVAALPLPPDVRFALVWALKEAVMKAKQTGFRLSPQRIRLTVDAERRTAGAEVDDGTAWALRYEAWDAYVLAVAVAR